MALNLTDYRFRVVEIESAGVDNATLNAVPFAAGQYIISDDGYAWYDPSTGSTIANRISLGKITADALAALTTRVQTAETAIISLEGRMDTAEGDITAVESRLDTAESDIDTLQADVQAIEDSKGQADGIATLDSSGNIPMSQMPDALVGAVVYQGTWDASTGQDSDGVAIPAASADNKGHYYITSVTGSWTAPSTSDPISFENGDWLISDGVKWSKVDTADAVTSVAGKTGAVTLETSDIQGLDALVSGKLGACYEVIATTGQSDIDALGTVATSPKQGDIGVVKRLIASDKYEYTGYYYDGAWKALDGNYNAENVYFSQDLLTTTAIGNITLSGGQATISAAGKNLKEVFDTIYVAEDASGLRTANPAANITGVSLQYIEVGSSATATGTVTLSEDGDYKYGYTTESGSEGDTASTVVNNGTTGVTVDSAAENPYEMTYKVGSATASSLLPTDTKGAVFSINSGVQNTRTSASVTGTVHYTDGYIPVSNLKKMYPNQKITASSASRTTELFRWYVPMYSGFKYSDTVIASPATITEAQIKELTATTGATAYNQTVPSTATATSSWRQYFIAVPEVWGKSVSAAKDSNNLTLTVSSAADVEMTFGTATVNYKVFYINNAADYDTLQISLTW